MKKLMEHEGLTIDSYIILSLSLSSIYPSLCYNVLSSTPSSIPPPSSLNLSLSLSYKLIQSENWYSLREFILHCCLPGRQRTTRVDTYSAFKEVKTNFWKDMCLNHIALKCGQKYTYKHNHRFIDRREMERGDTEKE